LLAGIFQFYIRCLFQLQLIPNSVDFCSGASLSARTEYTVLNINMRNNTGFGLVPI
jgi:hypothetical protein